MSDFQRLATAVKVLTRHWAAHGDSASSVVQCLPSTMGRCNELAFATEAETLAYTIWHLIDRYGRILQVLDELFTAGHLPLRRKRMSVLEVGAGPSPAAYAVTDFYQDLRAWSASLGEPDVDIRPVTDLMVLDRGPAWGHLVHNLSEVLMTLGEDRRLRPFGMTYDEFRSFSVRTEHVEGIDRATRRLIAEADSWDEYLSDHEARSQAIRERAYPPGGVDLVVICNFLTHNSMVEEFAREIQSLAGSLTPGGVLVAIGSSGVGYNEIFDEVTRLATRGNRTLPLPLNSNDILQAHAEGYAHDVVEDAILDCLRYLKATAPSEFSLIRDELHPEVRHPASRKLTFPSFRVAAFKNEGARSQKRAPA
jgi:ribosomal protein RSM22 (predicted rRNA methylase)